MYNGKKVEKRGHCSNFTDYSTKIANNSRFKNHTDNLNNRRGDNSRKMAINKINCALITTAKMKKVKFHNVFL